jgi:hypothetical protein
VCGHPIYLISVKENSHHDQWLADPYQSV